MPEGVPVDRRLEPRQRLVFFILSRQGVLTQPAGIKPKGGDKQVRADHLTGSVKFEVAFHWSSANAWIRASERLVMGRVGASVAAGEVFNVKHPPVCPDERRRWFTL